MQNVDRYISRSSVGGGSSWWCAPFGGGTGAVQEPDYVPPQRHQPLQQQWAPPAPKVCLDVFFFLGLSPFKVLFFFLIPLPVQPFKQQWAPPTSNVYFGLILSLCLVFFQCLFRSHSISLSIFLSMFLPHCLFLCHQPLQHQWASPLV